MRIIKENCKFYLEAEGKRTEIPFFHDDDLGGVSLDTELKASQMLRVIKIGCRKWEAKKGDAAYRKEG